MDVASLIVRAGYDGAALTRGLAKSASDVQRFGANVRTASEVVRAFKLPDLDITTSSTALRQLGIEIGDVERELKSLGISVDRTSRVLRDGSGRILAEAEAMKAAAAAIAAASAQAKEVANLDAALRGQISTFAEGSRLAATQSDSLKQLRTIYAQLSREVSTGNLPLERRIRLEQDLVRIRREFANVTASSRATSVTTDFAAAAVPVQRTANALGNVARNTATATSRFALINKETGEFTAAGRRASGAAIGIAFGLEAIARGGSAAEGGLRTALRSVAGFAAFFGSKGLIISGAAAATAAIIDLFTRSREEMQKTQAAFEESLTDMVRNGDLVGIMREMQRIEIGEINIDPNSGLPVLGKGLIELRKELALLERAQESAYNNNVARSGFSAQGQAIRDLKAEIEPLQKRYDQLANTIKNFPQLPRLPALPPATRVLTMTNTGLAEEAFKALREEVENTTRSATQLAADLGAQQRIAVRLIELHTQVKNALKGQREELGASAVALRAMVQDIENVEVFQAQRRRVLALALASIGRPIPPVDPLEIRTSIDRIVRSAPKSLTVPIELKPRFREFDIRNFEQAVQRVRDAQGLVDFAELTGDSKFFREAEQNLQKVQQRLEDYANNVRIGLAAANVPLAIQRAIIAEIVRLTQGLKKGEETTASVADNIQAITTGVRGLLQISDAFTDINGDARQALESVLSMGDALATISRGGTLNAIAGTLGLIGGAVSALNSVGLLGDSPIEEDRMRVLEDNTREMSRLRLELSGFTFSVRQQAALARDLANLTFGPHSRFKEQVEALGFDLSELAVIAREKGIEIFDSAGNIIPTALHQLGDSLRLAADAAIQFSNRFEDQRTKLDLLNKARGIPDSAEQAIADSVELFKGLAPELFNQYFGTLNLGDANASRQAIERFLLDWFNKVIPTDAFDAFTSTSEVVTIIDAWLDGIGRMTEAANEVTRALLNVPEGFKIERARFNATLPDNLDPTNSLNLKDRPLTPKTGPSGPKDPLLGRGNVTFVLSAGAIQVDARDRPISTVVDQITTELQRRARARGPFVKAADALD